MTSNECVEKIRSIMKKIKYDFFVISDDPDCECDFGVDREGNLIVCGFSTFFKIADLEGISYRDDIDMEINDAYIHFYFNGDNHLYIYYDRVGRILIGDRFVIYLKNHEISDEISRELIYSNHDNWDLEGDFLIDKEGILLAYIGDDREVIIPDKVKKIGSHAFYWASKVERVICPEALTEICDRAFVGNNGLKEIDLSNVEVIGDNAFQGRKLSKIIIPCTVKEIGKEAFYYCGSILKDNIINYSNIIIDETILKEER